MSAFASALTGGGALFASIRAACAEVAIRARHVHIAGDPGVYARGLNLEAVPAPRYDLEHHFYDSDPETLASFVITLDAINFGSGYFSHLIKRPGLSGYFTVASALKDHFVSQGAPSAQELSLLKIQEVAVLLGQDLNDPVRYELLQLFTVALNDLGNYLDRRHGGRFLTLVGAAGRSAENLVRLLAEMPLYRDVAHYEGFEVPFYKRAQITASDLALAFGGEGPGEFVDLSELTLFADNLVPHVLRVDGLLEYDADLLARLERGEMLAAGSPQEVELRAVAVHAVERVASAFRAGGLEVTPRRLDILLWNRGQDIRYRGPTRHRTRTPYY